MVTPENARLNLRTAAQNVRAALGLREESSSWTFDQRTGYNKALAAKILEYPQSFTPEILESARLVAAKNYTALDDTSIEWSAFAVDAGLNVAPVLENFTNKLLLLGLVIGVVWVLANSRTPSGPAPVAA